LLIVLLELTSGVHREGVQGVHVGHLCSN
jgi:hypothetical protein